MKQKTTVVTTVKQMKQNVLAELAVFLQSKINKLKSQKLGNILYSN